MEPSYQRPRLDYADPATSFRGNRYHGMDVMFVVAYCVFECVKACICIRALLHMYFVCLNVLLITKKSLFIF